MITRRWIIFLEFYVSDKIIEEIKIQIYIQLSYFFPPLKSCRL